MKYSVAEIDEMRRLVSLEGSEASEERLRTYMLNGTTVEDLQTWTAEEKAKRMRAAVRARVKHIGRSPMLGELHKMVGNSGLSADEIMEIVRATLVTP